MRPFAESPWKQRLLYFAAGALLAVACGLVGIAGWIPWLAVGIVVVLRIVKGRRVRAGSYFLGTLAPMVAFIAWIVFGPVAADLVHRQTFDAETWRSQDSVEHDIMWPPRLCMVDNLMSSGKLDGLEEAQVLELLGPPHDKSFPFGAVNCDIHYYLGPERGSFRMDSEWLFIKFGEDDRVSRYWLYTD